MSDRITSTITSKNQTTVPSEVRYHLKLKVGDEIEYLLHKEGVLMKKVDKEESTCPCCNGTGRCKIKKESDSG